MEEIIKPITIPLKDNQVHKNAYEFADTEGIKDAENLVPNGRLIPNEYWDIMKSVNKLKDQHKIVTFPAYEIDSDNEPIFDRINDRLFTYNWVGVISNRLDDDREFRIEITSRFDNGKNQYFLLYLLCNVLGVNIFDLNTHSETESEYTIILIMLFLKKLIDTCGDGLYKEYVRNEYNDYNFKGAINVNRHILINNPFVGKTAYSVREHSYDNDILCLIRQTMDYISDYYPGLVDGYINCTNELSEFLDVIETATPSYRINVNYADSVRCQKEITNPLYHNYEDARKLALMILRESGQNIFDEKDEESFSLLIDISWLWEEFIAVRLLNDNGYRHLRNRSRDKNKDCLEWSENNCWYPDYIDDKTETERRCVLDAKYKHWNWNSTDVHQLLSYLFLSGGEKCGIIYPVNDQNEYKTEYKTLKAFKDFYEIENPSKFFRLPVLIPQYDEQKSFEDYCRDMDSSINNWKSNFDTQFK